LVAVAEQALLGPILYFPLLPRLEAEGVLETHLGLIKVAGLVVEGILSREAHHLLGPPEIRHQPPHLKAIMVGMALLSLMARMLVGVVEVVLVRLVQMEPQLLAATAATVRHPLFLDLPHLMPEVVVVELLKGVLLELAVLVGVAQVG
jgi:hypothetical protein